MRIIFLTNEPVFFLLNLSLASSGICPFASCFLPEVNLYKSMEVNLLRRLCAHSGYGGTLSPLVTEHPSSAQWRLCRAVTSLYLLTPSPQPTPKTPPCTSSYSSPDNKVMKIDLFQRDKARIRKEMYCIRCYLLLHSISAFSLFGCPLGLPAKRFFLQHRLKGGSGLLQWKVDLIALSFIM